MKDWPEDHPKAKAMARKRSLILSAAKVAFLNTGYAGTSMDAIAQEAGISLMTLYRHAESKDDLFAAVISGACDPDDEGERRRLLALMDLPLDDVLRHSAVHMQDILTRADTVALLRLVIAEATTFPHLTELAYQGFVAHFERTAGWIIGEKLPEVALRPDQTTAAARLFVDRVIGSDLLRVLLGRPVPTDDEKWRRAELACEDALQALPEAIRGVG